MNHHESNSAKPETWDMFLLSPTQLLSNSGQPLISPYISSLWPLPVACCWAQALRRDTAMSSPTEKSIAHLSPILGQWSSSAEPWGACFMVKPPQFNYLVAALSHPWSRKVTPPHGDTRIAWSFTDLKHNLWLVSTQLRLKSRDMLMNSKEIFEF